MEELKSIGVTPHGFSRLSMIGISVVPGLPKMYSTPPAIRASMNICFPLNFLGMKASLLRGESMR